MSFNFNYRYFQCGECGEVNKFSFLTTDFPCVACGYFNDAEKIITPLSELEKEQRKTAEKMVKHLLPTENPKVRYQQRSISKGCWGWTYGGKVNTICLPRQTFYLPREQFTDTIAHESAHIPSWDNEMNNIYSPDPGHGDYWRPIYLGFRAELLREFANWIKEPGLKTRFKKPYNIYPKKTHNTYWGAEYSLNADGDDKFNP